VRKRKDWLARNQDNVPKCGEMFYLYTVVLVSKCGEMYSVQVDISPHLGTLS
jgi:hypothetical protein